MDLKHGRFSSSSESGSRIERLGKGGRENKMLRCPILQLIGKVGPASGMQERTLIARAGKPHFS